MNITKPKATKYMLMGISHTTYYMLADKYNARSKINYGKTTRQLLR